MSISRKKTRILKLVESNVTTWEEALKEYLLWKKAEGRSERTLRDYSYHPYQLRHTFALEFLRNGGNSFALQKTLGHADLNMTKRYVSLADNDIKKQHLIASPVVNLIQQNKRVRKL